MSLKGFADNQVAPRESDGGGTRQDYSRVEFCS
jgi:hypothetical protein